MMPTINHLTVAEVEARRRAIARGETCINDDVEVFDRWVKREPRQPKAVPKAVRLPHPLLATIPTYEEAEASRAQAMDEWRQMAAERRRRSKEEDEKRMRLAELEKNRQEEQLEVEQVWDSPTYTCELTNDDEREDMEEVGGARSRSPPRKESRVRRTERYEPFRRNSEHRGSRRRSSPSRSGSSGHRRSSPRRHESRRGDDRRRSSYRVSSSSSSPSSSQSQRHHHDSDTGRDDRSSHRYSGSSSRRERTRHEDHRRESRERHSHRNYRY